MLEPDGSVGVHAEVPESDAGSTPSGSWQTTSSDFWDEEAMERARGAGMPGPRMQMQAGGNPNAVRVFVYGLEEDLVWDVIEEMGMSESLRLTAYDPYLASFHFVMSLLFSKKHVLQCRSSLYSKFVLLEFRS